MKIKIHTRNDATLRTMEAEMFMPGVRLFAPEDLAPEESDLLARWQREDREMREEEANTTALALAWLGV